MVAAAIESFLNQRMDGLVLVARIFGPDRPESGEPACRINLFGRAHFGCERKELVGVVGGLGKLVILADPDVEAALVGCRHEPRDEIACRLLRNIALAEKCAATATGINRFDRAFRVVGGRLLLIEVGHEHAAADDTFEPRHCEDISLDALQVVADVVSGRFIHRATLRSTSIRSGLPIAACFALAEA